MSGLITQQELCTVLSKKIDDSDSNSKLSKQQIGVLTSLKTSKKDSLVNAINELYNNTINGKNLIKQAIEKMGVTFDGGESIPSYQTLHDKILEIKTQSSIPISYRVELLEKKHLTGTNGNNISYNGSFTNDNSVLRYYSDQNSLMLRTFADIRVNGGSVYHYFYHHIELNSFKLLSVTENRSQVSSLESKMIAIPETFETNFGTLKCTNKHDSDRYYINGKITLLTSNGAYYDLIDEPHDRLAIVRVVNGDTFIITNASYKYTYKIIPEYE